MPCRLVVEIQTCDNRLLIDDTKLRRLLVAILVRFVPGSAIAINLALKGSCNNEATSTLSKLLMA
jgi:hypothetical protein